MCLHPGRSRDSLGSLFTLEIPMNDGRFEASRFSTIWFGSLRETLEEELALPSWVPFRMDGELLRPLSQRPFHIELDSQASL